MSRGLRGRRLIGSSEHTRSLLMSYGPLSVILYSKIRSQRLFPLGSTHGLLVSLTDYYAKTMQETRKSGLKRLVDIFPSSTKFLELLKKHKRTERGVLFFKLIVDISENYHKTEAPLYEKLRNETIPLAIKFYSKLNAKTIAELNLAITSNIKKSRGFGDW